MGYYVNLLNSSVKIAEENLDKAYQAVCAINDPMYDGQKRGGSFGGDKEVKWYSWMGENYPDTCKDLAEVLEMLGFEVETVGEDGSLSVFAYNSKTGQENLFFQALAPFIVGEMEWRGEDGCHYKWCFDGEEMVVLQGTISYE